MIMCHIQENDLYRFSKKFQKYQTKIFSKYSGNLFGVHDFHSSTEMIYLFFLQPLLVAWLVPLDCLQVSATFKNFSSGLLNKLSLL